MSTIDENILKSLETLAETMRDKRASIAAATDDLERKMATMRDSQTVQPPTTLTPENSELGAVAGWSAATCSTS